MLDIDDFTRRIVPFLHRDGVVSADTFDALTDEEQRRLVPAAPLIQTRIQVLSEASGMLGFLFVADKDLQIDEKSQGKLKDDAADVLSRAIEECEKVTEADFGTEKLEEKLRSALVDEMGIKPRLAFTPMRVAVTGKQVSPPLFESMEILGKESSLKRLRHLRDVLAQ